MCFFPVSKITICFFSLQFPIFMAIEDDPCSPLPAVTPDHPNSPESLTRWLINLKGQHIDNINRLLTQATQLNSIHPPSTPLAPSPTDSGVSSTFSSPVSSPDSPSTSDATASRAPEIQIQELEVRLTDKAETLEDHKHEETDLFKFLLDPSSEKSVDTGVPLLQLFENISKDDIKNKHSVATEIESSTSLPLRRKKMSLHSSENLCEENPFERVSKRQRLSPPESYTSELEQSCLSSLNQLEETCMIHAEKEEQEVHSHPANFCDYETDPRSHSPSDSSTSHSSVEGSDSEEDRDIFSPQKSDLDECDSVEMFEDLSLNPQTSNPEDIEESTNTEDSSLFSEAPEPSNFVDLSARSSNDESFLDAPYGNESAPSPPSPPNGDEDLFSNSEEVETVKGISFCGPSQPSPDASNNRDLQAKQNEKEAESGEAKKKRLKRTPLYITPLSEVRSRTEFLKVMEERLKGIHDIEMHLQKYTLLK